MGAVTTAGLAAGGAGDEPGAIGVTRSCGCATTGALGTSASARAGSGVPVVAIAIAITAATATAVPIAPRTSQRRLVVGSASA